MENIYHSTCIEWNIAYLLKWLLKWLLLGMVKILFGVVLSHINYSARMVELRFTIALTAFFIFNLFDRRLWKKYKSTRNKCFRVLRQKIDLCLNALMLCIIKFIQWKTAEVSYGNTLDVWRGICISLTVWQGLLTVHTLVLPSHVNTIVNIAHWTVLRKTTHMWPGNA